jgi:hypothetical protein
MDRHNYNPDSVFYEYRNSDWGEQKGGSMNSIRQFFRSYSLTTFFVLAYLLSWWFAPLSGGQIIPQGPTLAAVIVLAIAEGRQGLAGLWRQVSKWRVAWYWYLVAPGIVLAYLLAAYITNRLLGASIASTAHLAPAAFFPLLIELILVGGWWEEPGWSGFALPRLLDRFSNRNYGFLIASLILGVFRAIWRLPLLASGYIPWYDVLVFSFAFQLIITWLYLQTGGSVLIVMLFHLSSNIIGGGMFVSLFSGADQERFYQLFVFFASLTALVLLLASWKKLDRLGRSTSQEVIRGAS